MIIYTNMIPEKFDAASAWPFIFIRKASKGDEPLLAHEMVHYEEQRWITPYWLLRYWLSLDFRLIAEIKAYKVQINHGGISVEGAANMLMLYGFDLTKEEVMKALRKE